MKDILKKFEEWHSRHTWKEYLLAIAYIALTILLWESGVIIAVALILIAVVLLGGVISMWLTSVTLGTSNYFYALIRKNTTKPIGEYINKYSVWKYLDNLPIFTEESIDDDNKK